MRVFFTQGGPVRWGGGRGFSQLILSSKCDLSVLVVAFAAIPWPVLLKTIDAVCHVKYYQSRDLTRLASARSTPITDCARCVHTDYIKYAKSIWRPCWSPRAFCIHFLGGVFYECRPIYLCGEHTNDLLLRFLVFPGHGTRGFLRSMRQKTGYLMQNTHSPYQSLQSV